MQTFRPWFTDELGMAAAEIIGMLRAREKFGRAEGFGCAAGTVFALQSDYVRLAAKLEDVTVYIVKRGACDKTAHPYWIWIEKI